MSGNPRVQRVILIGWAVFGWIVLILVAGLLTLFALAQASPRIAPGPYHDLFGTLFVMVAWPVITVVLRFLRSTDCLACLVMYPGFDRLQGRQEGFAFPKAHPT
jgi:hypothetical protein